MSFYAQNKPFDAIITKIVLTSEKLLLSVSPEVLRELMQTQSELFFGEATESTYELLDTILSSFSMVEDSIYELMLAMAYAGNEVNEKAVEKIKDIYTSHKVTPK